MREVAFWFAGRSIINLNTENVTFVNFPQENTYAVHCDEALMKRNR